MNIVFISTYSNGISLSKVISYISKDLLEAYDCYLLALDMEGSENFEKDKLAVIPCFRSKNMHKNAQFVGGLLDFIRPKLVVVLHDLGMLSYYFNPILRIKNKGSKLLAFLPIDGELTNLKSLHSLLGFDHLVFYSQFAMDRFNQLGREVINKNGGGDYHLPKMSMIPHGVDTEHFCPIGGLEASLTKENRKEAKEKAFPDHPQMHDALIVLNGNRAWERKRLDLTIKGFANFKKQSSKKVFLYLHLPKVTEGEMEEVNHHIDNSGAAEFIVTRASNEILPIEQLNWIYNACEIGVNTAMGEGWGLVSCEHAVTGAAQIVPDHTHFREIWNDAGVFLRTEKELKLDAYPFLKYHEVSTVGLSESIAALVESEKKLMDHSKAAYSTLNSTQYRWQYISEVWKDVISTHIRA